MGIGWRGRELLTGVALAAAASFAPAAATAQISAEGEGCEVDPSAGEMRLNLEQHVVFDVLDDSEIGLSYKVYGTNPPFPSSETFDVHCTVAGDRETAFTPTVTNIDSIEGEVDGLALKDPLAPGRTTEGEADAPEIEISIEMHDDYFAMLGGVIQVYPTPAADGYLFGQTTDGVVRGNLNATSENEGAADIDLTVSPEQPSADPSDTSLYLSAAGGDGQDEISYAENDLGGPVYAFSADLNGGPGADRLVAGAGGDLIGGGEDGAADVLIGGAGNDRLEPGLGDDVVDGRSGADSVTMFDGPAVRVDLRMTAPQDTGQGLKVIAAIERVYGSDADDVLIGTDGPDELISGNGDDTVLGMGGDDALNDFGNGDDRIRGGVGNDLVRGWRGDDRLYGGPGDDRLIGGERVDSLFGNGGIDRLDAFDEPAFGHKPHGDRRISCGHGEDAAESARTDERDPRPLSC